MLYHNSSIQMMADAFLTLKTKRFTFQYGSIQMTDSNKDLIAEIKFTFQYGSIQILA